MMWFISQALCALHSCQDRAQSTGKSHWKEQGMWHLPSWGIDSRLVLGSSEVLHVPGPRQSGGDEDEG